ncbi:MAG: YlxR family protein [Chloroflexi bacterium]|nr:YlxR family protein [Chloroflexota bacterium]
MTTPRKQALPPKHIPQRRCVSCGQQRPQRELVRIVRLPSGEVSVNVGRKKLPGRGAYLCYAPECWEKALKRDRLSYALKGPVSPEDRQRLQEFAQGQLQQAPTSTTMGPQ